VDRILLAFAASAMLALPAAATEPPLPTLTLEEAVAFVQANLAGEVIAARFDYSKSEAAHYHIDLRLPHGAVIKIELEARSQRLTSMPRPDSPPVAMRLIDAVRRANEKVPGTVTAAEFDWTSRNDPHYHVDVRQSTGEIAHVRVGPNGEVDWRHALGTRD